MHKNEAKEHFLPCQAYSLMEQIRSAVLKQGKPRAWAPSGSHPDHTQPMTGFLICHPGQFEGWGKGREAKSWDHIFPEHHQSSLGYLKGLWIEGNGGGTVRGIYGSELIPQAEPIPGLTNGRSSKNNCWMNEWKPNWKTRQTSLETGLQEGWGGP